MNKKQIVTFCIILAAVVIGQLLAYKAIQKMEAKKQILPPLPDIIDVDVDENGAQNFYGRPIGQQYR